MANNNKYCKRVHKHHYKMYKVPGKWFCKAVRTRKYRKECYRRLKNRALRRAAFPKAVPVNKLLK